MGELGSLYCRRDVACYHIFVRILTVLCMEYNNKMEASSVTGSRKGKILAGLCVFYPGYFSDMTRGFVA